MEARIAELESQPSVDKLATQERELRDAVRAAELELATGRDELARLSSLLPEAQVHTHAFSGAVSLYYLCKAAHAFSGAIAVGGSQRPGGAIPFQWPSQVLI